jgi:hypothetical protein
LGLHISDFSKIFYGFYKIQLKGFTIEVVVLHRGPWKLLILYKCAPGSHKIAWKEINPCNWVPGKGRRHGQPGSGESGGALARGGGGARPHAHLGLAGDRSWGREVAGEGARWRPTAVAAAGSAPATRRRSQGNARH